MGQKPIAPNLFPGGRALSEQLVGGRGELVIEHKGREYRLRLTQSGKLILTA
ncbi:MAG TPA: hemin uptake protein HemP [Burkholderiales bacterium]|nr:hemin uptake protein HemP [Burkholderiales bacterium]